MSEAKLTEEQLKRIAVNRQKALAIRQALAAKANNHSASENVLMKSTSASKTTYSDISSTTVHSSSTRMSKKLNSRDNHEKVTFKHSNCTTGTEVSGSFKAASKASSDRNYSTSSIGATNFSRRSHINSKSDIIAATRNNVATLKFAQEKATCSKPITGNFCLLSKDRFTAHVGYHFALIEIFKAVSSKQYDSETKQWSFSIEDHEELSRKVKALRPAVCLSPLPEYVITALKDAKMMPPLSSVDLQAVSPRLLEALLPFQKDGVRFGIRQQGRVLIADDMGLGKTIQALGIASYYRSEWPLLVVTPSSVRYSWLDSVERWLSGAVATVINSKQDAIRDFDVVITSYDLLTRRSTEFGSCSFGVIIMDESHMLKNFKSARYKAASKLLQRARRVVLLSGTPALSRPSEVYTQVAAVDPRLFPKFQDYGIRYCAGRMGPWGWDFTGSSNLAELQIILQAKVMIRRLKSEVLEQLPSKQRKVVILTPCCVCADTKEILAASAAQLQLKSLKGTERHSALLEFFRHSARAKLKAVSEYIEEMLEAGHKFLVFAHHKIMVDNLAATCDKMKTKYIRIEGNTYGDTRQALVNEFQSNDDVRVAILSITAAGTGLTLTAASLVVFAELYWNPGILVQAEDRVHRLGQRDCVFVHYLVVRGTADDYIWPMVQHKLDVLGEAGLSEDNFSEADATFHKTNAQDSQDITRYFAEVKPDKVAVSQQECLKTEKIEVLEQEFWLDDWDDDVPDYVPTKKLKT